MAAKFELYKDRKGEFRFRFKAGNGEIVLTSEGYQSKASAKNGIDSVKRNAPNAGNFEMKTATNGKERFNLKASNGQIVGTSQLYSSASGCRNGVQCVQRDAPGATVEDVTA